MSTQGPWTPDVTRLEDEIEKQSRRIHELMRMVLDLTSEVSKLKSNQILQTRRPISKAQETQTEQVPSTSRELGTVSRSLDADVLALGEINELKAYPRGIICVHEQGLSYFSQSRICLRLLFNGRKHFLQVSTDDFMEVSANERFFLHIQLVPVRPIAVVEIASQERIRIEWSEGPRRSVKFCRMFNDGIVSDERGNGLEEIQIYIYDSARRVFARGPVVSTSDAQYPRLDSSGWWRLPLDGKPILCYSTGDVLGVNKKIAAVDLVHGTTVAELPTNKTDLVAVNHEAMVFLFISGPEFRIVARDNFKIAVGHIKISTDSKVETKISCCGFSSDSSFVFIAKTSKINQFGVKIQITELTLYDYINCRVTLTKPARLTPHSVLTFDEDFLDCIVSKIKDVYYLIASLLGKKGHAKLVAFRIPTQAGSCEKVELRSLLLH